MIIKKILTFILIFNLLIPGLANAANAVVVTDCNNQKTVETYNRLCKNVDDIICKKTPDRLRRSCEDKDQTIIHSGMTADEIYQFAKGCFKSVAHSFASFFTEFIPELCQAIWDVSKDTYKAVTDPGLIESIKGKYESARSIASDVSEAIKKNPGAFFNNLWSKITDAVGPMVANYDCLNPQAKVEKICGIVSEWVMPPALLAKVIVRGSKAAKELIDAKILVKSGEKRTQETELAKALPVPAKEVAVKAVITGGLETSPELHAYIAQYSNELQLKPNSNRDFIAKMAEDAKKPNSNTLYFDVENSVQKTLNDSVLTSKTAVDAVNNSFFEKLYANLRQDPELLGRLDGEYKDYKSYRLRLNLKPGDDPKKYEARLNELYRKANNDFSQDLAKKKISQQIPPRNDGINDTTTWFLSGSGGNSLEANMAARAARNVKGANPNGSSLSLFNDHIASLHKELNEIEGLRAGLSSNKDLLDKKIIEQTASGTLIPSKPMITILRKVKPGDFQTDEEYIKKVKSKGKEIFGYDLDADTIHNLSSYFKKVDSISPPLFSEERVIVDLGNANHGIISVDFAGIGVDNIQQQMKELAESKLKNATPEAALKSSFTKMQAGVDQVTKDMNNAKDVFSKSIAKIEGHTKTSPQFSGDDGIHMPADKKWEHDEKIDLIQDLAKNGDPSKYRITFVSSNFSSGKIINADERSKRIVRAETVEKDIRAKITGIDKIPESEAKKFLIAVDYAPKETGGMFNLIISGKDLSPKELDLIKSSFESTLSKEGGESMGKVILQN